MFKRGSRIPYNIRKSEDPAAGQAGARKCLTARSEPFPTYSLATREFRLVIQTAEMPPSSKTITNRRTGELDGTGSGSGSGSGSSWDHEGS